MATFKTKYTQELKKEAAAIRKTLTEFEEKWEMSSDDMLAKIRNEPDYKKKLTVAETVWMVEYGRYKVIMDMLEKRM